MVGLMRHITAFKPRIEKCRVQLSHLRLLVSPDVWC